MSDFLLIAIALVGALVVFVAGPLFLFQANARDEKRWKDYFDGKPPKEQ